MKKTEATETTKPKKVWQKPMLTVLSSTQQIQGGGNFMNTLEAGQANGKSYIAPKFNPAAKSTVTMNYFDNYHS